MDYAVLKTVHQTAAVLSFAGFFGRGLGALLGAAWVRGRAAKTLPHIVDTALLASALTMAWMLAVNPLAVPWLLAKIVGLLAYIVLGVVALRSTSAPLRAAAWIAALLTFGYIVSVALRKHPAGFLNWLPLR